MNEAGTSQITREALRSSQQMLGLVLDNIPQAIFWKDRDSVYLGCNPRFATMAGFRRPDDVVGLTDHEMPWRSRAEAFRASDREILEGRSPRLQWEGPYTRPGGDEGWLTTTKVPLYDAAGRVVGVLGVDEDCTDRRRLEEATQSVIKATFSSTGEDFFHALVRYMAEVLGVRYAVIGEISRQDPGKVQSLAFWNGGDFGGPLEYDLHGSPCGAVVGRGMHFVGRDVRQHYPDFPILEVLGAESYLGAPLFDSCGRPIGLIVAIDDRPHDRPPFGESLMQVFATRAGAELERKRSEEALIKSERRYRQLFEDSPISLWQENLSAVQRHFAELRAGGVRDFRAYFTGHQDRIKRCLTLVEVSDVNQATLTLFGATSKEHFQAERHRTMLPESFDGVGEALILLAEGNNVVEVDCVFQTFDGKRLYTVNTAFVAPGHEQDLSRLLIAMTDLSARRQAEEALRRAHGELERRVEERTAELAKAHEDLKSLLYIVSHDLRAPLVNLKGFCGELTAACHSLHQVLGPVRQQLPPEEQQLLEAAFDEDIPEALGFIDTSVNRIDHFMNTLLRLSQEGRRELVMEPLDLEALFQELLQVLAFQIEQGDVDVSVGELPALVADRISLEQILGNLLSNAVLYLDPERPGRIEISGALEGGCVELAVRDNGRGIAADEMDKIFLPFRRGRYTDIEGEGMGLAYVQALVHRYGGRIACESEVGVGSCFTVTLPLPEVSSPEAPARAASPPPETGERAPGSG